MCRPVSRAWLACALLVSCAGGQNFDDGEGELVAAEPRGPAEQSDGGPTAASVEAVTPVLAMPGTDEAPSVGVADAAADESSVEPAPVAATEPESPDASAPSQSTEVESAPTAASAEVDASANAGNGVEHDASVAGPTPPSAPTDAGAPATSCDVDACSDHGSCIERGSWALCSCDPTALPTCELPLFREIGPSRTSSELILVAISGDGTTLVGSHLPSDVPGAAQVGVTWTLDAGLRVLPQDPAGPTLANAVNFDASLILGAVAPSDGSAAFEVLWRDGVLGRPLEGESVATAGPTVRSVEELTELLDEAGIDASYWDIWNVNDTSDDGKVIFGLGLLPDHGARWLLRLP